MRPASTSLRLTSAMRAKNGVALAASGTTAAQTPIVVPTRSRVSGRSATRRIVKGVARNPFTTAESDPRDLWRRLGVARGVHASRISRQSQLTRVDRDLRFTPLPPLRGDVPASRRRGNRADRFNSMTCVHAVAHKEGGDAAERFPADSKLQCFSGPPRGRRPASDRPRRSSCPMWCRSPYPFESCTDQRRRWLRRLRSGSRCCSPWRRSCRSGCEGF
jgi:hypothetical protein